MALDLSCIIHDDTVQLSAIADQLERWANESRSGGWSTHQVDPMRRLAENIREHVAIRCSQLIRHRQGMADAPSPSDLAAFRAAHPRVPESDADRAMLAGAERVELDPQAARDGRRGRPC